MTRVFTIILSIALVLAVAAPPVAAQSETDAGVVSVDFGDDLDRSDSLGAAISGYLAGVVDGLGDAVAKATGNGPTADEEADALASEITDNREAYRTHLNGLLDHYAEEYDVSVANETEVLRVDITGDDGTESVWIRVAADGENITALNASRTETWTATRSHELPPGEAEDLNEDLDEYRTEYVESGEYPEPTYFIEQGSKYVNISEVST